MIIDPFSSNKIDIVFTGQVSELQLFVVISFLNAAITDIPFWTQLRRKTEIRNLVISKITYSFESSNTERYNTLFLINVAYIH